MKFVEKLSLKNKNIADYSPVTAAFLGDSVTQGCFELVKDHTGKLDTVFEQESAYHQTFKQTFAKLFPTAPINIINAGISGNTAQQGLDRIKRDVFAYSPDLVVVCFGLNDSMAGVEKVDQYKQAVTTIFQKVKEKEIDLLFLTPNMMNTYVDPSITDKDMIHMAHDTAHVQNSGVLDTYMEAALQVCHDEEVPVCDCYKKWKALNEKGVDTTKLLSNYINHPTREMHQLFAHELSNKILFN